MHELGACILAYDARIGEPCVEWVRHVTRRSYGAHDERGGAENPCVRAYAYAFPRVGAHATYVNALRHVTTGPQVRRRGRGGAGAGYVLTRMHSRYGRPFDIILYASRNASRDRMAGPRASGEVDARGHVTRGRGDEESMLMLAVRRRARCA